MNNVYEQLRERLDDFASGYPSTDSGIEIRILKKLFSEDEAELFLKLLPLPETPEEAAERLYLDPGKTAALMECMAKKGLLFRLRNNVHSPRYHIAPFLPGIYDFQLKTIDQEFAQDMQDYTDEGLGRTIQGNSIPIMRTIPIKRELIVQWPVAPYEDAIRIIEEQEIIAVAPCVCRTKSGLLGESCGKPIETCLMFGRQAEYYVDNMMGRFIGKEEAVKIVKQSDEAGLVIQPFNSRKIGVMCNCCGDCCEMLGSLKMQPIPAAAVKSNYFAAVNSDDCTGCETCIDRCQMEAITIIDERAAIDLDRCIGCGLCVTTCPNQAMCLNKKEENEQYIPPKSGAETFMQLAVERNKKLLSA